MINYSTCKETSKGCCILSVDTDTRLWDVKTKYKGNSSDEIHFMPWYINTQDWVFCQLDKLGIDGSW